MNTDAVRAVGSVTGIYGVNVRTTGFAKRIVAKRVGDRVWLIPTA